MSGLSEQIKTLVPAIYTPDALSVTKSDSSVIASEVSISVKSEEISQSQRTFMPAFISTSRDRILRRAGT